MIFHREGKHVVVQKKRHRRYCKFFSQNALIALTFCTPSRYCSTRVVTAATVYDELTLLTDNIVHPLRP